MKSIEPDQEVGRPWMRPRINEAAATRGGLNLHKTLNKNYWHDICSIGGVNAAG